ncbi:hypothetical protein NL312_31840, partial [Klebsiella pneumoniae]|nr:hypothetical protein [Klebsiella pneumoniae]
MVNKTYQEFSRVTSQLCNLTNTQFPDWTYDNPWCPPDRVVKGTEDGCGEIDLIIQLLVDGKEHMDPNVF